VNQTGNNFKNNWLLPKILFNVFLVFIMVLYAQYAYLALSPTVYGKNIDEFAKTRNTVKTTLKANRGVIYDSLNNVLAVNVSSYTVVAFLSETRTGSSPTPKHVVDKEMTAKQLAPVLNMTEERLLTLLNSDLYQVELGPGGRNITELKKEEIENLRLPGIAFMSQAKRYYPNGDFASYIIGYAKQYEKTIQVGGLTRFEYDIVGELSIEGKYNDLLKGVDGSLEYQRDIRGFKIPDTKEERINPLHGNDIYLTIDSNVQRFLEDSVKNVQDKYNPDSIILVAMDAKTGKILGSSTTPSFDPNKLNITNYENPLTSYLFEPGSIMKIYTYMCAIEKGTYRGQNVVDTGSLKIGNESINDWNKIGFGSITFDKGFEYSSNVVSANLVKDYINRTELQNCLKDYGFGTKTEIELARELEGNLRFQYPIEVAAASFGQGITTTAIQQLQALSIIANNGTMLTPRIIDKIVNSNTKEIEYEFKTVKKENIVSKSTTDKVKDLMYNVVHGQDKFTTGRSYYIENFDVIAKTATAEVFNNKTGKYDGGLIYSFGGMFPKEDPEIIIFASVTNPSWGITNSLTETVKPVIENIAKYLNIYDSSNQHENIEHITVEDYTNKDLDVVLKKLSKLDVIVLGSGNKVIMQNISSGVKLLSDDKIILLTNDKDIAIPNLKGWSSQDAVSLLKMINVKYDIDGYGFVTNQIYNEEEETISIILSQKYEE
jgi:penicillin-binding protein 2B